MSTIRLKLFKDYNEAVTALRLDASQQNPHTSILNLVTSSLYTTEDDILVRTVYTALHKKEDAFKFAGLVLHRITYSPGPQVSPSVFRYLLSRLRGQGRQPGPLGVEVDGEFYHEDLFKGDEGKKLLNKLSPQDK